MLRWNQSNPGKLATEFKYKLHPKLRGIILELEGFCHRHLKKDLEVISICRSWDEEIEIKEDPMEGKHQWTEDVLVIDLANLYGDEELTALKEHLAKCGARFVPLVRKDKRGEYLHVEVALPGGMER